MIIVGAKVKLIFYVCETGRELFIKTPPDFMPHNYNEALKNFVKGFAVKHGLYDTKNPKSSLRTMELFEKFFTDLFEKEAYNVRD